MSNRKQFKRLTPHTAVQGLNVVIRATPKGKQFEGTLESLKSSKKILQDHKKKVAKAKKDLKRFRANKRAGVKNKGWITRKLNEIAFYEKEAKKEYMQYKNYVASKRLQDLFKVVPNADGTLGVVLNPNEKFKPPKIDVGAGGIGKGVGGVPMPPKIIEVKPDFSNNKEAVVEWIYSMIGDYNVNDLYDDNSPELAVAIEKQIQKSFGSVREYNRYLKDRNKTPVYVNKDGKAFYEDDDGNFY